MPGTNDNRTSTTSLRPSHVRSVALAATIVGVVVLPIAAAQATPSHNSAKQASVTVTGSPATGAPATATAALPQFCGATGTGFQSQVTEQSCVDDTDGTVTAVVYVGNTSDKPLTVAVNLTRSDGSLAQMQCTIVAHDANGSCTTGALQAAAGKGSFNAIAEAVPVGSPVALGVLHVESGQVAPQSADAASSAAGSAASASPSVSASSSPAA